MAIRRPAGLAAGFVKDMPLEKVLSLIFEPGIAFLEGRRVGFREAYLKGIACILSDDRRGVRGRHEGLRAGAARQTSGKDESDNDRRSS
jgi:hypothetical protein